MLTHAIKRLALLSQGRAEREPSEIDLVWRSALNLFGVESPDLIFQRIAFVEVFLCLMEEAKIGAPKGA
jgi:hypothetical protein